MPVASKAAVRLERLVALAVPVILPGWTVKLHLHGDPLPIACKDAAMGYRAVGRCDAKWEYAIANLHFDLVAFEAMEPEEQASWVVHEIMHAAVNEMRVRGIAHEERVVCTLTGAFVRAMRSPALRRELQRR